jgi:predicted RNase H-like HicB family nuclease
MELAYTYWQDGDWYIGYLNTYPEHLTQGQDLSELEAMLRDLYAIRKEEDRRLAMQRKSGILRIPA